MRGEWFASTDDSTFFLADTISFIKRTNRGPHVSKHEGSQFLEGEHDILDCIRFINLDFQFWSNLEIWDYKGYASAVWIEPMSWKLTSNKITLQSDTFKWKFEVIEKDSIQFRTQVANHPTDIYETYSTPKWTLKRIKN